ncbi:TetR/AcrR family transcriptional regulator [Frondihabitans cladoniiphilus]|uniref:TetR family transcriptional regulator n=1 Tax=Frondihabitans cladoniiphilus TaxID=715785 RepID=A0ABP8W7E6_9MICO
MINKRPTATSTSAAATRASAATTRKPAAPTRKPAAERAADIAAAARRVAVTDGLGAVTLRGVAAEAGVTSALVAHYEPSIQALVARTFTELATAELDEVKALIATAADPIRGVRMLVSTLLAPARHELSALWADAWSLGRRNPPLAEASRGAMAAWHGLATAVIDRGVMSGDFTPGSSDRAALLIFALIDATTAYALVDYRAADERDELVRRTLEISLQIPSGGLSDL